MPVRRGVGERPGPSGQPGAPGELLDEPVQLDAGLRPRARGRHRPRRHRPLSAGPRCAGGRRPWRRRPGRGRRRRLGARWRGRWRARSRGSRRRRARSARSGSAGPRSGRRAAFAGGDQPGRDPGVDDDVGSGGRSPAVSGRGTRSSHAAASPSSTRSSTAAGCPVGIARLTRQVERLGGEAAYDGVAGADSSTRSARRRLQVLDRSVELQPIVTQRAPVTGSPIRSRPRPGWP